MDEFRLVQSPHGFKATSYIVYVKLPGSEEEVAIGRVYRGVSGRNWVAALMGGTVVNRDISNVTSEIAGKKLFDYVKGQNKHEKD